MFIRFFSLVMPILLLSGCSDSHEQLPIVNESNCKNKELIMRIQPLEQREKFQEDCNPFTSNKTPSGKITSPKISYW